MNTKVNCKLSQVVGTETDTFTEALLWRPTVQLPHFVFDIGLSHIITRISLVEMVNSILENMECHTNLLARA